MRGIAKAHLWQEGTRSLLLALHHHAQSIRQQRATGEKREQATIDVDQVASTLVATTDPTASRQLSELDHALGNLSKGQREVVLLVGLEGMRYEEAAKILRVPIGTIRSRLGRARQALRLLMGIDDETASLDRIVPRPGIAA